MAKERKYPAPQPNPETQRFWDAAKQGKLLICKDNQTGDYYYYPRTVSPFSFTTNVDWVEAKGTGTIYSVSVMERAPEPYAIGYVELDEGPRIVTNFVDCDLKSLKIGQKVKLTFKDCEGGEYKLPVFTPA